jgi:hypothetical protein
MTGTDAFGEEKPKGLLARVFGSGRSVTRTTVRRTEVLNLDVATDHADSVRAALVDWLHGYGIDTDVSIEPWESGKSRIHAKLGESDSSKLDLGSEKVQRELEDVLASAIH